MEKDEKYLLAKKRVKELKGFYNHLVVYIAVITLLFIVDYQDGGNWWFYYPAIGWGIFVLIQGVNVSRIGMDWEEKKIKEIMKKEK